MSQATYEVFFKEAAKTTNGITPRQVIAIDDRNCVECPPGFASLGIFSHPSHDRSIVMRHKLRDFLGQFGMYDLASMDVTFSHFERAVFYTLPEELTLKQGTTTILEVGISPPDATNSVPSFEVEDDEVISITPEGAIHGLKPGETILMVRASDNPVLLYEVPVRVEAAEAEIENPKVPEPA